MRYCPEFENEAVQRLIAAQFARKELLRQGKLTEQQTKRGVKRVLSVHGYSGNIGLNAHRLAKYLLDIFRVNMSRLDQLVTPQMQKEMELFLSLKGWAQQTTLAYDSRGDLWKSGTLEKASRWTVFKEPFLPKQKAAK